MKNHLFAFLILFMFQYGNTQSIDLDEFDRISAAAGHKVSLISSNSNYAEIEMIKGDIDDLVIEVKNNTLKIKSKKNGWFGNKTKAEVKVYFAQNLTDINVSSGASMTSDSEIKSNDLDVDVSSGATCKLPVNADVLDIDVSSGARLTLMGRADSQKVDVSSGAKYAASQLITDTCNVDASSGAKAEVHCTKKIKGDASSGAKVVYHGDPAETNIDAGKYSGGSVVAK